MSRFWGLYCTKVLAPGGVMGLQLKSNILFNCTYTNIFGSSLEICTRLSVISTCSNRQSQFYMGKLISLDQSPAMNWYLKVMITLYSELCQCIPEGTT